MLLIISTLCFVIAPLAMKNAISAKTVGDSNFLFWFGLMFLLIGIITLIFYFKTRFIKVIKKNIGRPIIDSKHMPLGIYRLEACVDSHYYLLRSLSVSKGREVFFVSITIFLPHTIMKNEKIYEIFENTEGKGLEICKLE
jgi:hypothetical protein